MSIISPQSNIVIPSVNSAKPGPRQFAMAMTGRGRPTHLVSQNKRVRLWHRRLAHISNARVLRAAKLVDGMKLDNEKEYDPAEVLIDSDDSDVSNDR